MKLTHRANYSAIARLLFLFCLSTILSIPSLSAQTRQKEDPRLPAQVSPEDVMVRSLDWETYQREALAAGSDLAWVHGNSLHIERPAGFTLTPFGFASEVVFPAGATPGTDNWVHLAIPTPTFIAGQQARINRVILVFDSPASGGAFINRVDVWDGATRILLKDGFTFGGAGLETKSFEFSTPPFVFTGVGISIHIQACGAPEVCGTRRIRIVTAGAEFTRP